MTLHETRAEAAPNGMKDTGSDTIAIFDLDGTLTRRDTYLGILLHSLRFNPGRAPRLPGLAARTIAFKLGRIDNTALKAAFLKALLAKVPAPRLEHIAASFVDRVMAGWLYPEAVAVLERHRGAGHRTIMLTASPDFYVEKLAARLGFDDCICTETIRDAENTLTGELQSANCYGREKIGRLKTYLGDQQAGRRLVGYADNASDIELLACLHQGFIVNPGRRARSLAREAGLEALEWR